MTPQQIDSFTAKAGCLCPSVQPEEVAYPPRARASTTPRPGMWRERRRRRGRLWPPSLQRGFGALAPSRMIDPVGRCSARSLHAQYRSTPNPPYRRRLAVAPGYGPEA